MKNPAGVALLGTTLILVLLLGRTAASDPSTPLSPVPEYLTIHWDGSDRTHVIRPDGTVDFLEDELRALRLPARTHDRSFYLNVAINLMTKEGYRVVAITDGDILMERTAL